MLDREIDRLLPVARLTDDLVALFGEHLDQVHPDQGLVLGDEDTVRLFGVRSVTRSWVHIVVRSVQRPRDHATRGHPLWWEAAPRSALVSQLAEETDSKPVQCEFESHRGHYLPARTVSMPHTTRRCADIFLIPSAAIGVTLKKHHEHQARGFSAADSAPRSKRLRCPTSLFATLKRGITSLSVSYRRSTITPRRRGGPRSHHLHAADTPPDLPHEEEPPWETRTTSAVSGRWPWLWASGCGGDAMGGLGQTVEFFVLAG